ncbi:unnamed protein product [Auanema sp. JU1783]|nr:unnamed protein product [Auanema sp. JU1783]
MSKVQERVCVGSKCAKRSVVLDNGMVRIQKFCQSSDIRPGCRAAILWQGLPGEECVCDDGDFCNLCSRFLYTPAMLGFLFVSLYVMVTL